MLSMSTSRLFRPLSRVAPVVLPPRFHLTPHLVRQYQKRGQDFPQQNEPHDSSVRWPQQQHPSSQAPIPKKYFPEPNDGEPEYHGPTQGNFFPPRKVRYLVPAIWAISVSTGIFVSLAYFEAKEELRPRSISEYLPQWQVPRRRQAPTPTEVATQYWNDLNPVSKLSVGIIATNSAIHIGSLAPTYWLRLWHIPARNVNYTLFTSMWVHSGLMHFGFNMWACWNLLLPMGSTRVFEAQPLHILSFYLSAGVLSGYAQHLSTIFSSRTAIVPSIWIRSGGASGALFAMFGIICSQFPHQDVGIIFLPFWFEAQTFLPAVMLFDLIGMIRPYPFLRLGHAAHLSGSLLGVAYSQWDGKERVWKPLVRVWKRRLQ